MLWIFRVSFKSVELSQLGLHSRKLRTVSIKSDRRRTTIAGSAGSLDSGGMPQSSTPGIGGGRSRARMRDSSSCGSSDTPL